MNPRFRNAQLEAWNPFHHLSSLREEIDRLFDQPLNVFSEPQQFALGSGWATQIALVNSSGATATGRIDIFDPNGQPLAVKLNGAIQSTFTYAIPAGGTFVLAPRDLNGQSPL